MQRVAHFATVHWRSEDWIEAQVAAIRRHCPDPVQLSAYLNMIDPAQHQRFDRVRTEDGLNHAMKLNRLAAEICEEANDDDVLVFIDGDAFPIADLSATFAALETYPLIAVQRLENNGDLQPHPCFCVTTVGFWRMVGGDWQGGGYWKNLQGHPVTDVGGLLLENLEQRGIEWLPLNRSNARDLHPLWFAIYGDVVYHHGAGFRDKMCRLDAVNGIDVRSRAVLGLQRRLRLGRWSPKFNSRITRWIHDYMRRRNSRLADRVYASIQSDNDFCVRWGFLAKGSNTR